MAKIKVKQKTGEPPVQGMAVGRVWPSFNPFGTSLMTFQKPQDIELKDIRKLNPTTNLPLKDTERKSVKANPELIKNIVAHAKAKGVDPLTALAISYQETGLNKDAPFNLNPTYFGKPTGDPRYGVETILKQNEYAKSLQKRGIVPNTEEFLLQGYNGYGKINKGHADLEGANSIYGHAIPSEGIDFKKSPLYGKTILSLRDEVLKNNPAILKLIQDTPAFQEQPKTLIKIQKKS